MAPDQSEKFVLWHKWWFWMMLIPFTAIVLTEARLPLGEPWFWGPFLFFGGGVTAFGLWLRHKRLAGSGGEDAAALRAEIDWLHNRLEQRELADSIAQARRLLSGPGSGKGIVVIMFTDIEGFTRFVERHGDQAAHQRLRAHNDVVRAAVGRYGGAEVKHLGDGFMLSFASARDALLCAAAIQSALRSREDGELSVRIGIHAGEPIHDHQDFVGRTVIVAQRIMNQAGGGQVYVSEVVRTLVGPVKGYQYVDQGKRRLEGISEPHALYEFHPVEAIAAPPDSVLDRQIERLEQGLPPPAPRG